MPSSRQARMMRTAISPRLAISTERSFGMVNSPLPADRRLSPRPAHASGRLARVPRPAPLGTAPVRWLGA